MTPLYKEHVLDFGDLKLIGITCKRCNGEIVLDITRLNESTNLIACVNCGNEVSYNPALMTAINNFRMAYKGFMENKDFSVQIRIRSEAKTIE